MTIQKLQVIDITPKTSKEGFIKFLNKLPDSTKYEMLPCIEVLDCNPPIYTYTLRISFSGTIEEKNEKWVRSCKGD